MDLDRIITFVTKLGLLPATMIWLVWEFHGFIGTMASTQDKIIQLLQELVKAH